MHVAVKRSNSNQLRGANALIEPPLIVRPSRYHGNFPSSLKLKETIATKLFGEFPLTVIFSRAHRR